jgi:hypothetical protein
MRANEFINEAVTRGKITKQQGRASVGINVFRDPDGYDRTYELNRMMMAVACADGLGTPINVDVESWIGKDNSSQPYTQVEQDMLSDAAKSLGLKLTDLSGGDLRSQEVDTIHKQSPVIGFKGFGKETKKTKTPVNHIPKKK